MSFKTQGIRVDDVFVFDFTYSVTQSLQIKYSIYITYIYMLPNVRILLLMNTLLFFNVETYNGKRSKKIINIIISSSSIIIIAKYIIKEGYSIY